MNSLDQIATSGSYSASLVGTIRSHLEGLQGYDVMALELLQNADDAEAQELVFDVTDLGLNVWNSGTFTYCGDLKRRPCDLNDSCDYHRITEVANGGKLSRAENIGRFGIGFVSTYQITDHPEIRSSGIKLTLHPETGQWFVEPYRQPPGTTFFLPWADDPNTEARRALGVSHVSPEHIDQLVEDFQHVLRQSLLFLRHVRKAEIRKNGESVLACELDRREESELLVSFRPSGDVERWHVLRTDAKTAAEQLHTTHPRLEAYGRSTLVNIGIRINPLPLINGYLYAYLPTEQPTGLPLHINADSFPEADRKALIFSGHQHQQAWNEMLIDAAATELARDPEALLQMLGHAQLWQIVSHSFDLSKSHHHPACFSKFWERMKGTATHSRIALAQDGSTQCPNGVLVTEKPLNTFQVAALHEIGGRAGTEDLRSHRNALTQLGTPILTLDRLTHLMAQAFHEVGCASEVPQQRVENFHRPLWSIVNDLLPESTAHGGTSNASVQKLLSIPFIVTEDMYLVTINQSYVAPSPLEAGKVASLLPRLAILSSHLSGYPKIKRLVRTLELGSVASHLNSELPSSESADDVVGTEKADLRDLYNLLADLDRQGNVDRDVYQTLRRLPIWLSNRGLVRADQALLPGNFNDPTGQVDLLDPSALTDSAREFVSNKIGVQSQTIEAFVQTFLPRFFNEYGPQNPAAYQRLIKELADHPSLVNDEAFRKLLASLPLVPTQDGNWSTPPNTYVRSDDLITILGDAKHLWIDETRLPNSRSVQSFLENLGVRRLPIAKHLVERMRQIAEDCKPTDEARKASGEAFYVLCVHYDEWHGENVVQDVLAQLAEIECFPEETDRERWYAPNELHAPYRPEGFRSQAYILDFKNTGRLNTNLLEALGISTAAATELVVNHLLYCAEKGIQPHTFTYQILNERANKGDMAVAQLKETRCIYVDSQKAFVRPNRVYWSAQQLGRYAFTIPGNLEQYKALFTAIGVKNSPEPNDYVDFLLEIVSSHFEQQETVGGADLGVYEACLHGVIAANDIEDLDPIVLQRLQKSPSVLNLLQRPCHPDEILLQDCEWHATFFGGELNQALCKPAPELWPLFQKIGVRRLNECAEVSLEFVDGEKKSEEAIAKNLLERSEILSRLLHDKPTQARQKVSKALANLTAFSYDLVRIQAKVILGDNEVTAPPTSVPAFYDIAANSVILARPVEVRSWSHIFNALFHQVMPDEAGGEISKLAGYLRLLMELPMKEAHLELTDAGIPFMTIEAASDEDLTSAELDELGVRGENDADSHGGMPDDDESARPETTDEDFSLPVKGLARDTESLPAAGKNTDSANRNNIGGQHKTPGGSRSSGAGKPEGAPEKKSAGSDTSNAGKKSRPKHKEQWDRRLLSYVRKKTGGDQAPAEQGNMSEHNLAVEVVARNAVCAYEKARGRVAEQMPQTHPGYDIISRNAATGEERYIEVKGVNGEWNQTGVGLSRLQFSNAQDYGDPYWLYVVEFVSDPQHTRIHPIQSPASQVAAFMFDGNWRDAVTEERPDPTLAFAAGVRIDCGPLGLGTIHALKSGGATKSVIIDFGGGGRRTLPLNLHFMKVIEESDDDS